MPYEHFTYYDRLEVQHGLRQGLSRRAIAEKLGRAPSSISREVQRNRNKNGQYDAMKAQVQCRAEHLAGSSLLFGRESIHADNGLGNPNVDLIKNRQRWQL